ncbi:MAG TPA: hypothetical protein VMZ26_08835 [Pyrinomonadaceae bacterium]|nr:hypothetical protein [Pyrinomonadaceae bacterium]
MQKLRGVFVPMAAILFAFAANANSQTCPTAGCLDASFGSGGVTLTSINYNTSNNYALASALQPDGKIITAVQGYNYPAGTGQDFYVQRYLPDGSLDPNFGTYGSGGVTRITFTAAYDNEIPSAIAVQADGKIVVAGTAIGFAIARLNSDGTIDNTFGTGGMVSFRFASNDGAKLESMALQADGRVVLLGTSSDKFAFARLMPSGAFDTSFNGSGKVTISTVSNKNGGSGRAVAIQGDGKIVGVGSRPTISGKVSTGGDFAVMRLHPNGTLDSGFGSGGKVFTDFVGLEDRARSVAIDINGRLVVGGSAKVGSALGRADVGFYRYAAVRYNQNGTLDTTFGNSGKVTAGPAGYREQIDGLAIQLDGKIVAVGNMQDPDQIVNDATVLRFNPDGTLDATFGANGNGLVQSGVAGNDASPAVLLQPDGKIVTAGFQSNGDFVCVARFLP